MGRGGKVEEGFFFVKKKQKTFLSLGGRGGWMAGMRWIMRRADRSGLMAISMC
jgi:hypothetical protein